MKKKNLKTQQKELSRERIIQVATNLFKLQGYKATGIDQIMKEAGLTAGAFYAHFKSKEDLFEKSLEFAMVQSRHFLFEGTEHLTGAEKTEAVLKKYCSLGHRDMEDLGCVLPSLASEIYRGSTKCNQIVSAYIEKWADLIASHMDQTVAYPKRIDFALQIISRSVGAVLLSRIVKDTNLSEKILVAAQKIK